MNGKYTLTFDGNFNLMKVFSIAAFIKKSSTIPLNFIDDPEGDKNLILWKLCTDFAAEIKRFEPIIDRVVYCIDQKSWRKGFFKETDYKGNRTKASDIDWNKLFEVHEEFVEVIKSFGVTICRTQGAEADDLIFAWSSYLNQQSQNCIIVSGDNDLLQLINKDSSSNANTIYFNKFDKNLKVFPGFDKWIKDFPKKTTGNLFDMSDGFMNNIKENLSDIIKKNKMETNEINTLEYLFKKIIVGDSGDNISQLYEWTKETKRGTINCNITDKMIEKIQSQFLENKIFLKEQHFFDEDNVKQICNICKDVVNIPLPIGDIIKKYKQNRDLVLLHKKCIPVNVFDDMFSLIENNITNKMNTSMLSSISKDKLLSKTSHSSVVTTSFKNENLKKSDGIDKETKSFNSDLWDNILK